MSDKRRLGVVVAAILFFGCAPADDTAQDQPADTVATSTAPAADANGTWDMRATPVSGDTTPTIFQLQVANGTWTLMLPNREPVVANVVADADSFIVEAGPYQSVRREGMTVSTRSVYRINGDQMTGTTTARYQTTGADSTLQLTTTGTRVR
ncbi:MAG TPA: hypothetical protein VGD27_01660 [Longimicrobiales bacterium]